jgi:hypothetical protein
MILYKKIWKIPFLVNFANFIHILWSKNHVFKNLVEGPPMIWAIFILPHSLGYPKSVTVFLFQAIWVNKSLSMMCSRHHSRVNNYRVKTMAWSHLGNRHRQTRQRRPSRLLVLKDTNPKKNYEGMISKNVKNRDCFKKREIARLFIWGCVIFLLNWAALSACVICFSKNQKHFLYYTWFIS